MSKKDYKSRNSKLRERRQGSSTYTFDSATGAAPIFESYEKRARSESLRYALGAMQEVDQLYTQVSIKTGERVKNQLVTGLERRGEAADIRFQGSLPLNIHIRRYSDVDLLVLPGSFLIYDCIGPLATTYRPSPLDRVDVVKKLRSDCYDVLSNAFREVDVDNSGAKCIAMSGGSLARKVDVVPALWYDTIEYQRTRAVEDRRVEVLDLPRGTLDGNYPFKYMARVDKKDHDTMGGVKKAIRLLKTLKYDAETPVDLSSFDIASIVWNMPDVSLRYPVYLETAIIVGALNFLSLLVADRVYAESLFVADGTRKIIRSNKDFEGLKALRDELVDLTESIASELKPYDYDAVQNSKRILLESQIH
ncbi:conserved hypothetical protein [Cupriavidus phytorum]|uniref:cGAS/DncV-like nucleotidyltransferase C-terminal helical domain-containing protein n=2 Tax=Cupriavidus TaxID=106589 RepID=A0A375CJ86_9BURK|nr:MULTISPECIES: hypothetical protein [Cupriavidus]PZX34291.1 hypothetical protein C7416_101575 [Cupriavidus alkaliphilus]SOY71783.1 conserved hypothetical protein [Cupriavidus taiwanensis]